MINDHFTSMMAISERGLRLIKAFEGFRPVDRVLVTGTRVVGHGHRLMDDAAVIMDRDQAHDVLLDDLAPFEDMIRETVFAPLTQGQFDALVSLAFNIGPRAFLDSDILRAVNAGRPLDAAAGFDRWRQAEIAGQTFVVDALVRRRTAEKALFLRPSDDMMAVRAPGSDIRPRADATLATDMDAPTLDRDGAGRLLADAPYELSRLITEPPSDALVAVGTPRPLTAEPRRRRDDGPSGEMALTDLDIDDTASGRAEADDSLFGDLDGVFDEGVPDTVADEGADEGPALPASPIAAAADEVRDRLDALMDGAIRDGDLRGGDPADSPPPSGLDGIENIEDLIRSGLDVAARDAGDAILDLDDPTADVVVPFPTRATRLSAPGASITGPTSSPIAGAPPTLADGKGRGVSEPGSTHGDDMSGDPARGGSALGGSAREASAPEEYAPESYAPAPSVSGAPAATTINSLAADAAMRSRVGGVGDDPNELAHHDWSPSLPSAERQGSAWPFVLLFAVGGVLFGAGAALLSRGVGDVLGQPRDLVGLAAAMIGVMIILGALLYVLKTTLANDTTGDRT